MGLIGFKSGMFALNQPNSMDEYDVGLMLNSA
jgi:hypothetical protein